MCPDIEVFAPLIHATFGTAAGGEEADALPAGAKRIDLHVRLADRSLRQTNPVLGVVAQLLDLAGGRLAASQVLDLAGRAPVRRRFHLPHGGIFGRISESGCGAGRSCVRCTCASSPWPLCGAPCSRAAA